MSSGRFFILQSFDCPSCVANNVVVVVVVVVVVGCLDYFSLAAASQISLSLPIYNYTDHNQRLENYCPRY